MIAGERFYAAASIASAGRGPVWIVRPHAAQVRDRSLLDVIVARDSAADRCTSFIAAQTTPGGDTGVKSSITLPCATSS